VRFLARSRREIASFGMEKHSEGRQIPGTDGNQRQLAEREGVVGELPRKRKTSKGLARKTLFLMAVATFSTWPPVANLASHLTGLWAVRHSGASPRTMRLRALSGGMDHLARDDPPYRCSVGPSSPSSDLLLLSSRAS
jgi:hypothetical protein